MKLYWRKERTLYKFRWISWSNLEKTESYFYKLCVELGFAKIHILFKMDSGTFLIYLKRT